MASQLRRGLVNLHWFIDQTERKQEARNPQQGRRLVLEAIEAGGNNFLIVLVAGLGFFTDSYILFASNAITPMLAYVYWNDAVSVPHDLALNLATLGGCTVGMLIFGWLGDKLGRRKVYGWELLLLMAGTTGVVMSSTGYSFPPAQNAAPASIDVDWSSYGSMNIIAWLVWWRFITGVGIGGDYPLSATLVSEMAPTHRRARMLAVTFSMQAFGYAAANIVALVVTIIVRNHHPEPSARAVDQIWRWVIGLGLIPACIASILRLTIPESPRYTLDVDDNVVKAFDETNRFNQADLEPEWVRQANLHTVTSVLFGQGEHRPESKVGSAETFELSEANQSQIRAKQYFMCDGNWRLLAGTALTWFLLDIGFYALSLGSPRLIAKLWYQDLPAPSSDQRPPSWATNPEVQDYQKGIYTILISNNTHSLIISSIGALLGSTLMIYFIDKVNRKKFQIASFLALAVLFIVTGATFSSTIDNGFHGVTITLFILCVLAFYVGPNTLTFIIPAELFPTKYRATCHGISAAAGKVGSIITQVFVNYVRFGGDGKMSLLDRKSKWLGWVLLIFTLPMVVGALLTWWLIPDVQHSNLRNKTLEELVFVRHRFDSPQQDEMEMMSNSQDTRRD